MRRIFVDDFTLSNDKFHGCFNMVLVVEGTSLIRITSRARKISASQTQYFQSFIPSFCWVIVCVSSLFPSRKLTACNPVLSTCDLSSSSVYVVRSLSLLSKLKDKTATV